VPYRVSEAAWQPVFAAHAAMGITLLAAVLAKLLHFFSKKKSFQVIWAVLILITAGQLLIYRENQQSFEFHAVTLQSQTAPGETAGEGRGIGKVTATSYSTLTSTSTFPIPLPAATTGNKITPNAKPADKKRPSN
jgi:hypothetical protein